MCDGIDFCYDVTPHALTHCKSMHESVWMVDLDTSGISGRKSVQHFRNWIFNRLKWIIFQVFFRFLVHLLFHICKCATYRIGISANCNGKLFRCIDLTVNKMHKPYFMSISTAARDTTITSKLWCKRSEKKSSKRWTSSKKTERRRRIKKNFFSRKWKKCACFLWLDVSRSLRLSHVVARTQAIAVINNNNY